LPREKSNVISPFVYVLVFKIAHIRCRIEVPQWSDFQSSLNVKVSFVVSFFFSVELFYPIYCYQLARLLLHLPVMNDDVP